jgi:O-antigen ligase
LVCEERRRNTAGWNNGSVCRRRIRRAWSKDITMTQASQIVIKPASLSSRDLAKAAAWTLCLGLVAMLPLDMLFPLEDDSSQIRLIPHALKLGLLAIMSVYILLTGRDLGRRGFAMAKALILFIALLTAYVLLAPGAMVESMILYAKYVFWVAAALAFYLLALNGHLQVYHVVLAGSAVIAIASVASICEGLDESAPLARNGYAYTLLWCIPLVLLGRRWKLCLLPALLAAFTILFTFKRGASVALVLSGLVYLVLVTRQSRSRGRLIAFSVILLALAAGFAFWQWEAVAARWQDMGSIDTAGSNRGELYGLVLNHCQQGDLLNLVFGYGFNSVLPYLDGIGYVPVYAHSDLLEILHDQGLLGIAAFLAVHGGFIALLVKAARNKSRFLPSLAMGYCIFVCMNIYSGCTMYSETAFLSLLVGCAAGVMNREAPAASPAVFKGAVR